jgi:NAD(P)H-flavin reductase
MLMIAGGTGLAPMLSILHDLPHHSLSRRIHLFHGVRRSEEFYAHALLDDLKARNPQLEVVRSVSEEPSYAGLRGSLPEVVHDYRNWVEHEVMVAGSPALIQATVQTLSRDGVPLSSIHYDRFSTD